MSQPSVAFDSSRQEFTVGSVVEVDPACGVDTVWPIRNGKLKGAVRKGEKVKISKVTDKTLHGVSDIQFRFEERGGYDYPSDLFRLVNEL